jgi:hypothetical protein
MLSVYGDVNEEFEINFKQEEIYNGGLNIWINAYLKK